VDAFLRRLRDLPHSISWQLPENRSRENASHLSSFHNCHAGERCFIIGNGPSLKNMDLSGLQNEITFGMNRIYLLFPEWGFQTTYFVSSNERVIEQFQQDIRSLPMPKFLNWTTRSLFDPADDSTLFFKLRYSLKDRFSPHPLNPISGGATVTYVALQLAYFMGFSQVILIGVDHSFKYEGTPNRFVPRTQEDDVNHFAPDYFPKGLQWQIPDLLHSEIAYALARKAYEDDGRQILDATVGGQCPVFEKTSFEDMVAGSSRKPAKGREK